MINKSDIYVILKLQLILRVEVTSVSDVSAIFHSAQKHNTNCILMSWLGVTGCQVLRYFR